MILRAGKERPHHNAPLKVDLLSILIPQRFDFSGEKTLAHLSFGVLPRLRNSPPSKRTGETKLNPSPWTSFPGNPVPFRFVETPWRNFLPPREGPVGRVSSSFRRNGLHIGAKEELPSNHLTAGQRRPWCFERSPQKRWRSRWSTLKTNVFFKGSRVQLTHHPKKK